MEEIQLHNVQGYEKVVTFKEGQEVYEEDRLVLTIGAVNYTLNDLRN